MEIIDHINAENWQLASSELTIPYISKLDDNSKHKLKTQVSSLLKSQGVKRAVGCVLARQLLQDWSVLKTHGQSWCNIMIHILDLPDSICHKSCVNTLVFMFTQIQGKTDLLREIGSSNIGEFMKRLVNLIPQLKCYDLVAEMLQLYPTQCRPYLNKLQPLLQHSKEANFAKACLCLSEKQSTQIFNERLALEIQKSGDLDWSTIQCYLQIAPLISAKIPGNLLVNKLSSELTSLKPARVVPAFDFMISNFKCLESAIFKRFDVLVFQISETLDMSLEICLRGVKLLTLFVDLGGWISGNYTSLFTRLLKKCLTILSLETSLNAEGLADYVQNPQRFYKQCLSMEDQVSACEFMQRCCLYVPNIPQSVRVQIDKAVLKYGTQSQAAAITLYPGKYSILPLYLQKYSDMRGLECLVHPRFPPLQVSSGHLEFLEKLEDDIPDQLKNMNMDKMDGEEVDVVGDGDHVSGSTDLHFYAGATESAPVTATEEVTEKVTETLPSLPEPVRARREPDTLIEPPEKKVKLDEPEQLQSDSDDGMVIPTLTMDSD